MIDHSLLHPTMTDKVIVAGCELAKKYDVATACIKPYAIHLVKDVLIGSDVGICAVIAFPHGNSATAIKVREAEEAVHDGASEIDMVVNIGKVLGGAWDYVASEIRAVNEIVVGDGAISEGHLRERLFTRRTHSKAVRDLFGMWSRICQNFDRIRICQTGKWNVRICRSDRSSSAPDARALSFHDRNQSGRRRADSG